MNLEKTLFVTDLDGTLLDTKEKISDFSISTINSLVKKGINFTYATARSFSSAQSVASNLELKLPIVTYNGAFIVDCKTGKPLSIEKFTKKEIDFILGVLKKCHISPIVYALINGEEKVTYLPQFNNEGRNFYFSKRKGDKRLNPIQDEKDLFNGEIFYFNCIGEKSELEEAASFFVNNRDFNSFFHQEIYRSEYWLEIMSKNTSKANAIQKLKQKMNLQEIVSFGDGVNDIPMFEISSQCFAVKNADEKLKKVATQVIQDNNNDAVAKKLQELVF